MDREKGLLVVDFLDWASSEIRDASDEVEATNSLVMMAYFAGLVAGINRSASFLTHATVER